MDDKVFAAYVTNLGKYSEGELVGEWVKFPTTPEEIKKVYDRIGINEEYEEVFITDYDIDIYGMANELGEHESIDKLNYLAGVVSDLSDGERSRYEAVLSSGLSIGQAGIDGLINLAYNLDKYDIYEGILDEDDLGRYYAELSFGTDMGNKLGVLADYIDFERYGSDCQINDGGMFTDVGYIRDGGESWYKFFDGSLADIPDEYRLTGSEPESIEKLTVLVVEPQKRPYVKVIDHDLATLHKEVNGGIEAAYPFEDRAAIICNDEHKFNGSELNRCLRDESGEIYDIIAGTFLVTGLTEDNFGSLTPEQIDTYTEYFGIPEKFVHIGDTLVVLPMDEEAVRDAEHGSEQGATYEIYQLKQGENFRDYSYASMRELESRGLSVNPDNYEKVYEAPKTDADTLDSIYNKFNLEHPADFRGHSLSVSDVIVFHENGVDTAHYVDSFGFTAVPEFLTAKEAAVSLDTAGLSVEGHDGTWHSVEELTVQGNTYFLMESEAFGLDANMIVVDCAGKLVAEDITAEQRANVREIVDEVLDERIEDMAVGAVPDRNITQGDMLAYGYEWKGMIPLRERAAEKLFDAGLEIFMLHKDNSESSVDNKACLTDHACNGGIFGVEKAAWAKFIDTNYLKNVEELLEDDFGMIDGIINNGSKQEKETLTAERKGSVLDKLSEGKEAVKKYDKEHEPRVPSAKEREI